MTTATYPAVVNYKMEPGAVELVGYYTVKPREAEPAAADIAIMLRKRLPPYMVPDEVQFLSNLPTTSTDKVDYQGLRSMVACG